MAGRYTYGEQVANRASLASAFGSQSRNSTSQASRTRRRPDSIPLAEWEQILMVEEAIQHFEARFEEFMRSQSRLLGEIRSELEQLKAAVKTLEAKMTRLEGYSKHLDVHDLAERVDTMRLDETAFRRAEDKIAKLEPMLDRMERFAERLVSVEEAILELRTALAQIVSSDSALISEPQESTEHQDQDHSPGRETPDAPPRGRTALEAFFYALDHFGERLNGFEDHET